MISYKNFLTILLVVCLFTFFTTQAHANSLIVTATGTILFESNKGVQTEVLSNGFYDHSDSNKNILGASSGVVITVSVSALLPSDTPMITPSPTATRTPTPTPTTTQSSSSPSSTPTASPTPAVSRIPSITPSPTPAVVTTLLATIQTPSSTITEPVSKIVLESKQNTPVTITTSPKSNELIIQQGTTQANTTLPLQVHPETSSINAILDTNTVSILPPQDIIQHLQQQGSFILPTNMKINLINRDGQGVYQVSGQQNVEILGFFIIKLPISIDLSASTGKVLQTRNSIVVTLLEFFKIGRRVIH